jgi:hypothetical protein
MRRTMAPFFCFTMLEAYRRALGPTNRSVGGFNLIPVAVARDIRQAMPVGSFVGMTDAFQGMSLEVRVKSRAGE